MVSVVALGMWHLASETGKYGFLRASKLDGVLLVVPLHFGHLLAFGFLVALGGYGVLHRQCGEGNKVAEDSVAVSGNAIERRDELATFLGFWWH